MAVGCIAILGNVRGGTLRSGPSTDTALIPHVGESSLWNSEPYNAANNQHIYTLKVAVNENTSLFSNSTNTFPTFTPNFHIITLSTQRCTHFI